MVGINTNFPIGGPVQQPPRFSRNLTQDLNLPNFTSNYSPGLAQNLRGELFLFTGNPAVSPLIETMAYSQFPNFVSTVVSQTNPNNPLNTSIDSIFNAPLIQNGAIGGNGQVQNTGNGVNQTAGLGQNTAVFAPQQQQQQGNFPITGTGNMGGASAIDQSISQLQQLIQQATTQLRGLMQQRATMQQPAYGMGSINPQLQQLLNPQYLQNYTTPASQVQNPQQGMGYGYANPYQTMQGYGGAQNPQQNMGYGYANPYQTMQGYGGAQNPQQNMGYGYANPYQTMQGYGGAQQAQYNPYGGQQGNLAYALGSGQII